MTGTPCSIQRALGIVGDTWTILILRDAFRGVRRFEDFRRDLGIAKPVLANRLKKLVDAGVMVRRRYCEHPPRDEYRLTRKGMDLSPALVALMRWGDHYLADDKPPVVLVHEACGKELDLTYVCWDCNETFTPRDIASRPGPGQAATTGPSDAIDDTSPSDTIDGTGTGPDPDLSDAAGAARAH